MSSYHSPQFKYMICQILICNNNNINYNNSNNNDNDPDGNNDDDEDDEDDDDDDDDDNNRAVRSCVTTVCNNVTNVLAGATS